MATIHKALYRIVSDILRGRARWHISPRHVWSHLWHTPGQRWGLFRNQRGREGQARFIGFRWGAHVLGLEYGNRDGIWPEDHIARRA